MIKATKVFFITTTILLLGMRAQVEDFNTAFFKHVIRTNMAETMLQSNLEETSQNGIVCVSCLKYIEKLKKFDQTSLTKYVKLVFNEICPQFETKNVCQGIEESYVDSFSFHFFSHILNPQQVCANLDACPNIYQKDSFAEYLKAILEDQLTNQERKEWTKISSSKVINHQDFKVLQLADLHIDLEYAVGYNAQCDEPHCCREENGIPNDPSHQSQFWGSFAQCDLPVHTLKDMIKFIGQNLNISLIIWTGDNISHDVWHQNIKNQTEPTRVITELLQENLEGVRLFPIFGNHEAFPADQYDVRSGETQWLKDQVSDMWAGVMGKDENQSLRKFGYYFSYIEEYNLRVIAVNTQTCDSLNFYLMEDPTDPEHELSWLRLQLQEAESLNQFAYVFAHIPPGDTFCGTQWSQRYNALVERYQHVIKGQFYGHTHNDHIETIKSSQDGTAISTLFIAPSGTTYSFKNPSFRVFEMNAFDNSIKDYAQYRLDLKSANQQGEQAILDWQLAYTFLNEYGLKSASDPVEILKLADRMDKEKELLKKYIHHFNSGSDQLDSVAFNDLDSLIYAEPTKKYYTCGMKTSTFDDYYQCVGTLLKYKDHNFFMFRLIERLIGLWRTEIQTTDFSE